MRAGASDVSTGLIAIQYRFSNYSDCNKELENAQIIEDYGFFIGLPTEKIEKNKIYKLVDHLLQIDNY